MAPEHETPVLTGTHFWFMAIQTQYPGGGITTGHRSGVCTPAPGDTRMSMFTYLRTWVDENWPELAGGVAIAFDIQPNQL